ncbi:hypothetical protein ACFSUD_09985 [Sulfitobacter aestuarii]|uniref:Uncharacterized protein n=1 Tax=Sulfitobacter aestuarii TaxID=2161676 RepID=A0ABW5U3F4_9RHOB
MIRFLAAILLTFWAQGAAAQYCTEIRFAHGASSGEVSGQVADGMPVCYVFGAGSGQTARLQLFGSDNTCFTLPNVVDCQADFSFHTRNQMYEVGIFQLLRTTGFEYYTLRLTIY